MGTDNFQTQIYTLSLGPEKKNNCYIVRNTGYLLSEYINLHTSNGVFS